jgi:hypothetical protein
MGEGAVDETCCMARISATIMNAAPREMAGMRGAGPADGIVASGAVALMPRLPEFIVDIVHISLLLGPVAYGLGFPIDRFGRMSKPGKAGVARQGDSVGYAILLRQVAAL